jgi:hypothetical protein
MQVGGSDYVLYRDFRAFHDFEAGFFKFFAQFVDGSINILDSFCSSTDGFTAC